MLEEIRLNHLALVKMENLRSGRETLFPQAPILSVMTKVGLGFRVKSGWASAVVLAGPSSSPTVLHARHIDLCDPTVPDFPATVPCC